MKIRRWYFNVDVIESWIWNFIRMWNLKISCNSVHRWSYMETCRGSLAFQLKRRKFCFEVTNRESSVERSCEWLTTVCYFISVTKTDGCYYWEFRPYFVPLPLWVVSMNFKQGETVESTSSLSIIFIYSKPIFFCCSLPRRSHRFRDNWYYLRKLC